MCAMTALLSRPAFRVVLIAVAMAVPACAEQLSLQALVTPSTLLLTGYLLFLAALHALPIRFTELRYFLSQFYDAVFDGTLHADMLAPGRPTLWMGYFQ